MFTRRKILLALLEACGGNLKNTDMEKLLFVYCVESGQSYYDFFPYKFGCFSFLSYQDKRILTKQGFLAEGDSFRLIRQKSCLSNVDPNERKNIKLFAQRMKGLRGKRLIRYTYLNYPYYAIRSEIKEKVLDAWQLLAVESLANSDQSTCLMSIGYEGLTIDAYIDKLIQNNVAVVIDVRRNPISMKYGFSKNRFRDYLCRAGIKYEHLPELGIESSQRKNLKTEKDYQKLFTRYSSKSLPQQQEALQRIRQLTDQHKRVALTCFEAEPKSCHRHKITEYLQSNYQWDISIRHI
jgi:uncharacterized protein (DUF488 family)